MAPVQRAYVRLTWRRLDREIAAGAQIENSRPHSLRARELQRSSSRWAIAAALANILDAADERAADPSSRLVIEHVAVLGARDQLMELIAVLRSSGALEPRCIAMARLLTQDPNSPIYRPCGVEALAQALAQIAAVR
jgi:hypothetical protein